MVFYVEATEYAKNTKENQSDQGRPQTEMGVVGAKA